MPERSNGYQLPSWPMTLIDRLLWNSTMADLDERLKAREALEASFESLEAQGIQASLNYIQVNVAPQLASLKTSIDLAQEQIDQIIVGGKAPDTLKFGGQLPAYYATAQALSGGLAEKVPTSRKVNGKDLSADVELGKGDVGLDKVDNTADADKPVSQPQQQALDALSGALDKRLRFDAEQALTPAQKAQVLINLDFGLLQGDRSKFINGGFAFASWGPKVINPGGAEFVCDRWIVANNTNQPVTVTHQAVPLNEVRIPGNNRGKMRMSFATAPTTGTLQVVQRIEGVHTFAGRTASARSYFTGPAGNEALNATITQYFGTGGSPSATLVTAAALVDINKIYDAATMQRRAHFLVPSIANKTIGSNGGDWLGFTWELSPRQAGNYEIARASFVTGDAFYEPDPFFEKTIAQERPLIHRYFETIITYGRFFAGGGGQAFNVPHSWYPKRVVPSLQFQGLSSGSNLTSYGWADVAADNGGRFEIVSAGAGDCFALGAYYRVIAEL